MTKKNKQEKTDRQLMAILGTSLPTVFVFYNSSYLGPSGSFVAMRTINLEKWNFFPLYNLTQKESSFSLITTMQERKIF